MAGLLSLLQPVDGLVHLSRQTHPGLLYCSENIITTSRSSFTGVNVHVKAGGRNRSFNLLSFLIIDLDLDFFLINGLNL